MCHGKRPQLGGSLSGQMEEDLAAIGRVRLALDESGRFQAIDQLDRSVMAQREAVRQLANRRVSARGQSLKRQQSLVLVRLDPMLAGPCLAELKKMPELVAKFGQLLIVA